MRDQPRVSDYAMILERAPLPAGSLSGPERCIVQKMNAIVKHCQTTLETTSESEPPSGPEKR